MATLELITLEELKAYLALTKDTDDALLTLLIKAASSFLLAQMNRQEGLDHDYLYTNGLKDIPVEIRFACLELAALRYKEKMRIGEVSKAIQGQTVSYSQKDVSDFSRAVINQYKRVTP